MQRLDRVVQTLADFSRPMELHLREVDLRKVVRSVIELTEAEMLENNVQVRTELPRDPVPVRVDETWLAQIGAGLAELPAALEAHGGAIRVGLRREAQFAVVEVEDNGEGIPAALLPRIFELYFTTKPKGSGIGLAMTYRILQMHGGAMDVRSNADPAAADRGTTFTFRVPVAVGSGGEGRKIVGAANSTAGMIVPMSKEIG